MLSRIDIRWVWSIALIFIGVNGILLFNEIYWFTLIPVAIAILLTAVLSLEKIYWFLIFCTPLSLNLERLELGGIGMYIEFNSTRLTFGIPVLFWKANILFVNRSLNRKFAR